MMIKFHGGSRTGAGAAEYLVDFRDHKGRERPGIEVLRGNPEFVGNVIDSLPFKHRFTSGVIAWAPDDKPTPEQINSVLDSFERHAWVGLEPDRYAWTAVRHDGHTGKGEESVHLHILAARVDLETGKSLNIAPPGWRHFFIPWCNSINSKYGWASPEDPDRRLAIQTTGHGAGPGAQQKIKITEHLLSLINEGNINTRKGVVDALKQFGEIARTEKDYISVTPNGGGRNLRLRGVIYEEDFDGEAFRQRQADDRPRGRNDDPEKKLKTKAAITRAMNKRKNIHETKYGPASPPPPDRLSDLPMPISGATGQAVMPGTLPAPAPAFATTTRGDNNERNRESADKRAESDSQRAGRNESTLRGFDEAVARLMRETEPFYDAVTGVSIAIAAKIKSLINQRTKRDSERIVERLKAQIDESKPTKYSV